MDILNGKAHSGMLLMANESHPISIFPPRPLPLLLSRSLSSNCHFKSHFKLCDYISPSGASKDGELLHFFPLLSVSSSSLSVDDGNKKKKKTTMKKARVD
jgi:hypothetical protein